MTALLSIQQGDRSFAMEVLGTIRAQNLATVQNIRVGFEIEFLLELLAVFKAICYADMGRVEEAINVVHLLAEQSPTSNDRRRGFLLMESIWCQKKRSNFDLICTLDETHSNSGRENEGWKSFEPIRGIIEICLEEQSFINRWLTWISQWTNQVSRFFVIHKIVSHLYLIVDELVKTDSIRNKIFVIVSKEQSEIS